MRGIISSQKNGKNIRAFFGLHLVTVLICALWPNFACSHGDVKMENVLVVGGLFLFLFLCVFVLLACLMRLYRAQLRSVVGFAKTDDGHITWVGADRFRADRELFVTTLLARW